MRKFLLLPSLLFLLAFYAAALNNNLAIPRTHIFVKDGSTWVFEQEVQVAEPEVNEALCDNTT